MKKLVHISLLASAVLVGFPSIAAAQFYIGANVGQNNADFNRGHYASGVAGITESQDEKDTAFKLYGGFDINKNFAIEAGYADLGSPEYRYSATGISGQARIEQSAIFVAAKGTLPITQQFGIFGKLGLTRNKAELNGSTNSAAVNSAVGFPLARTKTKSRALIGIGAEYNFSNKVSLRAEYEDFGKFGDGNTTGETKARLLSIGVTYKF
jgi:OOP family OmpA-OmpF porin